MSDSVKLKAAWDLINANLVAIENEVLARYADKDTLTDEEAKGVFVASLDDFSATFLPFRAALQRLDAAMTKARDKEGKR